MVFFYWMMNWCVKIKLCAGAIRVELVCQKLQTLYQKQHTQFDLFICLYENKSLFNQILLICKLRNRYIWSMHTLQCIIHSFNAYSEKLLLFLNMWYYYW